MFELQLSSAGGRESLDRASHSPFTGHHSPFTSHHAPEPTFIIDTPGVKGFGLVDMTQEEIVDQFPEFFALKGECRFGNCKHMKEPGCAVLDALEKGEVGREE